jgi:hypothetical protein
MAHIDIPGIAHIYIPGIAHYHIAFRKAVIVLNTIKESPGIGHLS